LRIETSFGPLGISEDPWAVIERHSRFRQQSEEFIRDTDLGEAEFSLNFTMDEIGLTSVYLVATSGTPDFGDDAAMTPGFERDGKRIGYVCHVELDPARGTRRSGATPSTGIHDLDEPRRALGGIPYLVAPELQEEVGRVVEKAVDELLVAEPGLAARFEAACLTFAWQELDKEIKQEWELLSKRVSLRDRCRERAVQSANDALGKERDDMVEIKAVGDSDKCAWLWAYEQNLPHDSEWDEVVATGVGMLNINLPSGNGGYIDIDLVDGRSVSIAVSGKDIWLYGKVVDQSEAIAQVERAGVDPEIVSLINQGGDER